MTLTHFDQIDLTALAANVENGNRSDAAKTIASSDNPAHTVLALLRRMLVDRDADVPAELNNIARLVEYGCISRDEDVIAELKAGDIPGALRILGAA